MSTKTACRRRHRRHRMSRDGGASLEFQYPQPHGAEISVSLLDLSPAGFSFLMIDELGSIEPGSNIDRVVIKLGDTQIHGDVLIIHVNTERGVSGALFYPASDLDLIKLRSAVAAMEVVQTD